MSYKEAFNHMKICKSNVGMSKLQSLLKDLTDNKPDDEIMRWVKCDLAPLKPLFYCEWARCLYCFYCRADGEKWSQKDGCIAEIKSICFADNDTFDSKVFVHQTKKYPCTFCKSYYSWESLAIHERICYSTKVENSKELEDEVELFMNSKIPTDNLIKNDYLQKISKILIDVRKNFHEKRCQKKLEYEHKLNELANSVNEEELAADLADKEAKHENDKEKDQDRIKRGFKIIKEFDIKLEPPKQEETNFMLFKQAQKRWFKFTIQDDKLVRQTIPLWNEDRKILDGHGFKIIQTPNSNRVFLIGGTANCLSTFEFDLSKNRFFPEYYENGDSRIVFPLMVGRSYHSLAATSGLIFWTGGHPDTLIRRYEEDFGPNPDCGRIIEVFKLKDNVWIPYSEALMNSRYWHSSCIISNYLYLFHGYDASDSIINSLSIERIKIKLNESTIEPDSKYNPVFALEHDENPLFIRWFNSIYTYNSGNRIVLFGYEGFENGTTYASEQSNLRYSPSDKSQSIKKYTVYDEKPRHMHKKFWIESDEEEYKMWFKEFPSGQQSTGIQDNPIEEEYIHCPIYFRGLCLLPTMQKDQLAYYDEVDGRFKGIPDIESINLMSDSDSD